MSIHIHYCQECEELQVGSLLASGTRSMYELLHAFIYNVFFLTSIMMFYHVNHNLLNSCSGYIKQNITKSHMPMFITNAKLQQNPKLFFHCRLPLNTWLIRCN